uniref:Uncharacterized protein n=1 Tax=Amphimedon queenslandica TaxID=400682 RepID=A0A1X7UAR2_AMPQE
CNTTDPDIVFKYFIDVLQHFAVQNCRDQLCVGEDKVLGVCLSVIHSVCFILSLRMYIFTIAYSKSVRTSLLLEKVLFYCVEMFREQL